MTSAAQRALDAAFQFAEATCERYVSPRHLLCGLISAEGRASQMLFEAGVTIDQIATHPPLIEPLAPLTATDSIERSPVTVLSDLVDAILSEALRLLRHDSQSTEIGSEHLLWSLTRIETDASSLLATSGITEQAVKLEVLGPEIPLQPLEIELDLGLSRTHQSDRPAGPEQRPPVPIRPAADCERSVWRLLDAAANRAREGLRVVEDFVRFLADDSLLMGRLKQLRHALTAALDQFDSHQLLAARDTIQDVGTSISTASERHRSSPQHVLQANFKRVQESIRSLEEYTKTINASQAQEFERIRYATYTLEKELLLSPELGGQPSHAARLANARLYLLVTEAQCTNGLQQVVEEACQNGADIIQLREKQLGDRALMRLAERVRTWTNRTDTLLVINDRADVARACGADGLHVGQDDLCVSEARSLLAPQQLLGVSTHDLEQARAAVELGADYLGVGPTFPSRTKQFDEFAGLEFVREAATAIGIPWFPLGGIDEQNLDQVLSAGATRIAVSSVICSADHPGATTLRLARRLQAAAAAQQSPPDRQPADQPAR